jgi:hypothetical protein
MKPLYKINTDRAIVFGEYMIKLKLLPPKLTTSFFESTFSKPSLQPEVWNSSEYPQLLPIQA